MDMNKWAVRFLGLIMLLVFGLVFLQMYKQLVMLQKMNQPDPPAATSTR